MPPLAIVVLISGNGSNLQAIIDAKQQGLAIDIKAVISDRADAHALLRAQEVGIPCHIITAQTHPARTDYDLALQQLLLQIQPELIVMAGFMRILGASLVEYWQGRLINIHPSLLPRHRGLNTHRRALAAGDRQHGCSVHFVSAEVDAGAIIAQASCDISDHETESSLQQKIHQLEHQLYPYVLSQFCLRHITLVREQAYFRGKSLFRRPLSPVSLQPQT